MSDTTRIIGLNLTTKHLTLYTNTGNVHTLRQGDSRIQPIIDAALEPIRAQGYFDLPLKLLVEVNPAIAPFQAIAQNSEVIKFFNIAKSFLENLLGSTAVGNSAEQEIQPISVGNTTGDVVKEIMANARPMDTLPTSDSADTVVAIVDGKTVVPNAQKLTNQVSHAAENPDRLPSLQKFMRRLEACISERNHTIQDVLDFVENGNMPFADDGSVIVMKRLKSTREAGVFVDVHSGTVKQRVGDVVTMKLESIDLDRRRDCSAGLHVARWDYLSNFSGDVLVLCKLYPEDIVAVPHGHPSKVRTQKYTILAQITDTTDYNNVIYNRSGLASTETGKVLLARALAGELDPTNPRTVVVVKNNQVEYIEPEGKSVVPATMPVGSYRVKKAVKAKTPPKRKPRTTKAAKEVKKVDPVKKLTAKPVSVAAVVSTDKERPLSRAEKMAALVDLWQRTKSVHDLRKIIDYKRQTKVSWTVLGVSPTNQAKIEKAAKNLK